MSNPANILVGCGGSGIQTLMRLNGLMAEDPYWRYRVSRDIYYVLLDTELAMIDEFLATVDRQLADVDKPLIWSLRVAQGHVILHPLVRRFFVRPFEGNPDNRGKERLDAHWWHHKEHGPFTAPKVRPLTRGAGQCPAASYFLTWNSLRSVEDVFDRLIQELIARRSADGQDPLEELNFSIIAGLAGGTGRGSWQLIAFKVRELLTEKYGIPAPVAFLFDASVFDNIYRRYPRQEVPMKVNSLTGISELSCWMKNLRGTGKPPFLYELPSMESPHDPQMDVLSVDLNLDPNAAAPVDNAFLIFGGSKLAVLSGNEQYHEMVGAGLYAALSRSSIVSERINERPPYLSLGASLFEVNATTLRRYFEGLSRINVLRRLADTDNDAVDHAVEEFMRQCRLRIGITAEKRAAYQADPKGTLMQRACHFLMESDEMKFDFAALAKALEDDAPEPVQHAVNRLLDPRDALAEKAVHQAVASLDQQPEDVARELVADLLRTTRSVETVRRFVEKASSCMSQELGELPPPSRMQIPRDDDPTVLVQEYKVPEYFGLFGRHFNEDECNDLQDQTRKAVLLKNYRVLCEQIQRHYKGWITLISRWKTSADMILTTADKLTAKFKNELQQDLGTTGSDAADFFETLFTDAACPEEGVPDEFARVRFYRRDLKPVLARGEDLQLLGEPEFKRELTDVISRSVLEAGLSADAYDELDKLRRDMEAAIRRTVHLPSGFVEKNFSVRSVVRNLRRAWLNRFNESLGNRDHLLELLNRFQAFFGVRPKQDGEQFTLPSDEQLILQMGASLAATCRPYWRLRDVDQAQECRVSLFLPLLSEHLDKEEAERMVKAELERANVVVEVFTENARPSAIGDSRANPFVILAYSSDGTDSVEAIASLDYWQSPTVKGLLTKCEDASGQSVFEEGATRHNGVSYTDPMFVRHAALNEIRWKPWADKDTGAAVQQGETYDALLYALLEPGESLGKRLNDVGWSLPLVRNRGHRWYEFTRRARMWNDGQPRDDVGCPWKARMPIAQGLYQVFDVLAGQGRKDGSLVYEGPRWCDRIRQEAREFWQVVLRELKAPKDSEPYERLIANLEKRLDREVQEAPEGDPDVPIWQGLLRRLGELREQQEI